MTELKGDFQLFENPLPVLKDNEVLIKVAGCGVCHTDISFWHYGVNTQNLFNADLNNYLIATSEETPKIDSTIVDSYEPEGPFGAKEVGEGATLPILGAIANAIKDAAGVRIKELPITPEKILNAIKSKTK